MAAAIVDTGPLVAFLDRREPHRQWVRQRIAEIERPLLVCEPVLVEAMHLLRALPAAQDALLGFIDDGAIHLALRMEEHLGTIRGLMRKYRDVPMSLADACIVRMAEIYDRHAVLTLDSDFTVYRKHGRVPMKLICPAAGPAD